MSDFWLDLIRDLIRDLEKQIERLELERDSWKRAAEFWREQAAARTVPGDTE